MEVRTAGGGFCFPSRWLKKNVSRNVPLSALWLRVNNKLEFSVNNFAGLARLDNRPGARVRDGHGSRGAIYRAPAGDPAAVEKSGGQAGVYGAILLSDNRRYPAHSLC